MIQRFWPQEKSYFITRKRYNILHKKIFVQRSNEKPCMIFYLINEIQCFIIRISVTVCRFLFVCRAFILCEQNKLFWKHHLTKTYQMPGPHFRLYVGVYEINKMIHGHLLVWNLSSRVLFDLPQVAYQIEHEKINSISPSAHVLFSICLIIKLVEFY